MAYVNIRNNIALSAVNCRIDNNISINYGVNDYIYIYPNAGYSFAANNDRVTCQIFHTNGTTEIKTITKTTNYCSFTYGGGTNDKNGDIIFIWGYGNFLPTYPTLTNNITAPNGVTFNAPTAIQSNEFWFFVTPRISSSDAIGYTFKNVTATYHTTNGETTVNAEIKTFTNGLKRVFAKLTDYDIQYDTILNGVCGKSVNVGSYITNAVLNGLPSEVLNVDTLILGVNANGGYYFDSAPVCRVYTTGTVLVDTVNFTMNGDGTIGNLTIDLNNYPTATYIEFVGDAIAQPLPTYNFVNNVENATLSTSVTDTTVTATLTATNRKHGFLQPPTVTYNANGTPTTATMQVTDDGTSAPTATLTFVADVGTVTFNGAAVFRVEIDVTPTNGTVNGLDNGNYIYANKTYNLRFVAANGYCFEVKPTVKFWASGWTDTLTADFESEEEPHLAASITINITTLYGEDVGDLLTVDLIANGVPITAYNYGAINVYKVSNAILNDFAAVRYFIDQTSGNGVDLGAFCITLKRLYFRVGYTLPDVIKCANYATNVSASTPLTDVTAIDCGAVEIPTPNNTAADYDSEITAFLPFVGFVSLPSDYVGKTIDLQYVCSAVTGKGFAKFSYNGICFASYSCEVSDNLIFEKITNDKGCTMI